MKKVKMVSTHDPENGSYGDCYRCCIASLLDMDAEEVPHFLHDGCNSEVGDTRLREWLNERGMDFIDMAWGSDYYTNEYIHTLLGSQHYILTGQSANFPDCCHCVIAKEGKVVHDPSRSPVDHLEPCIDESGQSLYFFTLITVVDYKKVQHYEFLKALTDLEKRTKPEDIGGNKCVLCKSRGEEHKG